VDSKIELEVLEEEGANVDRDTLGWQEDRRSLPGVGASWLPGRKVRTPQGSVPDNVRDVSVKAHGRPVPQKKYRLGYPPLEGFRKGPSGSPGRPFRRVRVKWCGKSAPLRL